MDKSPEPGWLKRFGRWLFATFLCAHSSRFRGWDKGRRYCTRCGKTITLWED